MKRLVLIIFSALICGTVFVNCNSAEYENSGDESTIIGKWQLITISALNSVGADLVLIDHSPLNIIFDFKANSVLTVFSNADYDYGGFKKGKYFYKVTHTEISNGSLVTNLAQHAVEIDKIPYCFSIGHNSDRLELFIACWGECDNLYTFIRR